MAAPVRQLMERSGLTETENDIVVQAARCVSKDEFMPAIRLRLQPELAKAVAKLAEHQEASALRHSLQMVIEGKFIAALAYRNVVTLMLTGKAHR